MSDLSESLPSESAADDRSSQAARIEYYAPPAPLVDKFALAVCTQYAARTGDPSLADADVVKGFSAFVKLMGNILARQMSEQS
jgi:hypothetical protein